MDNRLPANKKEGFLYGSCICFITVIVMASLNIYLSTAELNMGTVITIIKAVPIIFVIAMLVENFIVGKVVSFFMNKFTSNQDSFNAKILFNIVFCVTGMSFIMSFIGGLFDTGFSIEILKNFPLHWPRNFFFAFWCECLIAQPFARFVMKKVHIRKNLISSNLTA